MKKKIIITALILCMQTETSFAKYTFGEYLSDNCNGGCNPTNIGSMGEEIASNFIKFGNLVANAFLSMGTSITLAINTYSAQKTADSKHKETVSKALMEAAENYDKTTRFNDSAIAIEMDKGSADFKSNDMIKGCDMLIIASNNAKKQNIVRNFNSASQDSAIKSGTTSSDTYAQLRTIEKTHKELFCSRHDVEIGYCTKEAGGDLQNLDRHASNIFAPNDDGMTYSKEQLIAANSYMDGIIASASEQALPESLEKTPAGKMYQQKLMSQQRIANASVLSLKRIINIRSSQEGK